MISVSWRQNKICALGSSSEFRRSQLRPSSRLAARFQTLQGALETQLVWKTKSVPGIPSESTLHIVFLLLFVRWTYLIPGCQSGRVSSACAGTPFHRCSSCIVNTRDSGVTSTLIYLHSKCVNLYVDVTHISRLKYIQRGCRKRRRYRCVSLNCRSVTVGIVFYFSSSVGRYPALCWKWWIREFWSQRPWLLRSCAGNLTICRTPWTPTPSNSRCIQDQKRKRCVLLSEGVTKWRPTYISYWNRFKAEFLSENYERFREEEKIPWKSIPVFFQCLIL